MTDLRIHIAGASCSGVTTLGGALARALGLPHLDTDDFFWHPSDPPYTDKRPSAERLAPMQTAAGAGGWVISGALDGWGDSLLDDVDLIVFLTAPTDTRLLRLKTRERRRFGDRIAPGGDMEGVHASFLVLASQYDDPGFTGRSRGYHEAWLAEQTAPVLRLDGTLPPEALVQAVRSALS